MPSPSPEVVVENLRRTLRGNIAYYAALRREALKGEIEDEIVELSFLLGLEWPADKARDHQGRLAGLLDSLCEAAREDQQATYERRAAAAQDGTAPEAVPAVTAAVDRWLERWLSGKEAGRGP
jgi:hypothetical protein